MTLKKCFSLLLALLLPCLALAEAPAPVLKEAGLTIGDHSILYPQLEGDDPFTADINARIVAACRADELLARLPLVMSGAVPLTLRYQAYLAGDVLSCAMLADGPLYTEFRTQVWSSVNIDLRTGDPISLADLFLDEETARAHIETYLEDAVLPELSAHLMAADLLPLPNVFAVTDTGITFYYPPERLLTLSDHAGAVTLLWIDLWEDLDLCEDLDLREDSILDRIGALRAILPDEHSAADIADCVEAGRLPGIPAELGGSMQDAVNTWRLLTDPDLYEAGRMVALEDSAFRGAWLLTDRLSNKWDGSVIQGIRADRLNMYGLCTGLTTQDDWRALLGDPDATVTVDETLAEAYRIEPGVSDYYQFGAHRLRLHAGETGVLISVFITD